ncbi:XapX domain-containing protein [Cupriavidus necator]|uniref:XapX domain-containing protein n=1 Tax=Cupriavidus necator TaxID=106590 RepID=UPI0005B50635|nr:XapX domain-containing protein [Cupriavidus necator]
MKVYFVSFGAGILVGIIYALLQVRSPAPPAIALLGLLGMLIGEQVVPTVKRVIAGEPVTVAWFRTECVPKISGAPLKIVAELGGTQNNGTVERDNVSR